MNSSQTQLTIGIIGNGFVGKATKLLACPDIRVLIYDREPKLCEPKGTQLSDLLQCSVIFVCVPTPMKPDGSCHLAIVESVVKQLRDLDYPNFIVIRSTVPIGTCDRLLCYFMPEFLTEQNYEKDFRSNRHWILGYIHDKRTSEFKLTMNQLFQTAYLHGQIESNYTKYIYNSEAEMVKLFRNSYLATKVSFCNEVFQFLSLIHI